MKRDFDLVRKLLLFFEDKPNVEAVQVPQIKGYPELEIKYHLVLLHEAGLLRCETVTSQSTPDRVIYVIPFSLTWQGHEFLDASRDETLWKKVTTEIKEQGLAVTFAVLQALLVAATKKAAGL